MGRVILYKNKNTGEVLRYNYAESSIEYLNYPQKAIIKISSEELLSMVKNNAKEKRKTLGEDELHQYASQILNLKRENLSSLVFERIAKYNPAVKKKDGLSPLSVRGIESLIIKQFPDLSNSQNKNEHNGNSKIKEITAKVLLVLEEKYFKNDDVPSFNSLKKIVKSVIRMEKNKNNHRLGGP